MPADFLANLKPRPGLHQIDKNPAGQRFTEDFSFRIIRNGEADFDLICEDSSGNTVTPVSRDYSGPEATLLRSMEAVRRENTRFTNVWATPSSKDDGTVSLSHNPHLLFQLAGCRNIIGPDGTPLNVCDQQASVVLTLSRSEKDTDMIVPSWSLRRPEEGDLVDFTTVTDSFVLAGDTLYPVESLGGNADQLPFFISPFHKDMLEHYLSVLYTYLENFTLSFENHTVVTSSEESELTPTLSFEKVDPDQALHLSVTRTLKGYDREFVERFGLTCTATIGMEGTITLRRLRRTDIHDDIERFKELLSKSVSTKKELREVYSDESGYFILPPSVAGPFLLRTLPILVNEYTLRGTDKLKEYKVAPVHPRLNMKIHSGIDFLEGSVSIEVGDESFTLGRLFEQYRRDRYLTLSDGTRAVLDETYMKRLQRIFGDRRDAGNKVRIGYLDLPEIEDLLTVRIDPSLLARERAVYEGFNTLPSISLDVPGLKASLRDYQKEGVKWIRYLHDNNLGGCLADDMGLGKTIQTIAMLSLIYPGEKKPSLIIMPRSLLFNWQNELKKFNPAISSYVYYQATRDMDEAMTHNVILTTYAMVRNDIEKFGEQEFHYVILDESQNIKNLEAQVTRATFLLKASHRLALSGTPVENNLSELYSLFRFLNPGMLGDLDDFNRRYASPIQRDNDKEAMTALRRRIFPFMLRRVKRDVLKELPDRVEQTLLVEMDRQQAEFYEQRRAFYLDRIQNSIATDGIRKSQFVMFQALTELRRIASVPESLSDGTIKSPKIEFLIEHLSEAVANGHKCVVFFNYIAGLEIVGEKLAAQSIAYETMTGATTNRRKVVEHFNNDPSCKVFLMTLKTGGVGLNLTVADTVFIFEPWWNKAAEEQAVNRLHRFGQKAKVHSYSLITVGTIEEKIRKLQEQKALLFEGLIGADSSSSKFLSEEDINFIFGK